MAQKPALVVKRQGLPQGLHAGADAVDHPLPGLALGQRGLRVSAQQLQSPTQRYREQLSGIKCRGGMGVRMWQRQQCVPREQMKAAAMAVGPQRQHRVDHAQAGADDRDVAVWRQPRDGVVVPGVQTPLRRQGFDAERRQRTQAVADRERDAVCAKGHARGQRDLPGVSRSHDRGGALTHHVQARGARRLGAAQTLTQVLGEMTALRVLLAQHGRRQVVGVVVLLHELEEIVGPVDECAHAPHRHVEAVLRRPRRIGNAFAELRRRLDDHDPQGGLRQPQRVDGRHYGRGAAADDHDIGAIIGSSHAAIVGRVP